MSLLLTGVGATGINRYSQISDLIDLSVDPSRMLVGNAAWLRDRSYLVAGSNINPLTNNFSFAFWCFLDSTGTFQRVLTAGTESGSYISVLFTSADAIRVQFQSGAAGYLDN